MSRPTIGIYGVSSQSGKAYVADYISRGYRVVGYARPSENGKRTVGAMVQRKGIQLDRPSNQNHEPSHFVALGDSIVTHDTRKLVDMSDVIILAIPSHYHVDVLRELTSHGLASSERNIPIVLSPSRTLAVPYIWQVVGRSYPVLSFSTIPYSCKSLGDSSVYIKRRKRAWIASLEGDFSTEQKDMMQNLFPQMVISDTPAATSLNNIGAVFHPAGYLMNLSAIEEAERENRPYAFYIDGIGKNLEVGRCIEKIDQVRLSIADRLGLETYGLAGRPREEEWSRFINKLREEEASHSNIDELRLIRRSHLKDIANAVISAQHWLDISYGVKRIPGEPLSDTILRTPTYQKNSVPQKRYIEEDIPTGLVPFEALARMLGIDHTEISYLIDLYQDKTNIDVRRAGRNLHGFTRNHVKQYLLNSNGTKVHDIT
mgnify:CR=1 FL=1